MTSNKSYIYFPLVIPLLLGGIIRFFYSLSTPLIETDGAVILLNARQFAYTGKISIDSSLAGIILGFIYRFTGEHLVVGKILESLVALITIIITYIFCVKAYNPRVAFLSSTFLAIFPLHVIFSYLCKGYTYTSLLIISSALLLLISIEKEKFSFAVLAGITASLAFFFRTFSMAIVIGIFVWLLIDLIIKLKKKEKTDFLSKNLSVFLISSVLFLLPFFAYRINKLGIYFFRDFGMPAWLQSMEYFYRGLWSNICDYYSLIYFIFLPSFVFFIYISFSNKKIYIPNLLVLVFSLSYIILAIINPGHHFPRILMPAVPMMCIIMAVAIDSVFNSSSQHHSPFLILTLVLGSIFYLFLKFTGPFNTPLENLDGILKMTFYVSISYLLMALPSLLITKALNSKSLFQSNLFSYTGTSILILMIIFYSIRYTYWRTKDLTGWINSYIQAIKFIPESPDSLLVYENAPFANLMGFEAYNFRDLELSDGIRMIRGDVEETARKYFIRFFVVPSHETDDRIYYTYREMSRRFTGKDPEFHSRLESSESISRIYDNGNIVIFFYPYEESSPFPLRLKQISLDSLTGKSFAFNKTEVYFRISGAKKYLKTDLQDTVFVETDKSNPVPKPLQAARQNISSFLSPAETFNNKTTTLLPIIIKNEKNRFSFSIKNHADIEENYIYNIYPEELGIRQGSVKVLPHSEKIIAIDFSLQQSEKKKIKVDVTSQSTKHTYSICFWTEKPE